MCRAILIATEVIKKGQEELIYYLTHCEETQEGSGQSLARGTPMELQQALYSMKAEYNDMCQEDDDWHWQEDQDLSWDGKWKS